MSNYHWSDEEKQHAADLWSKGLSATQVATRLSAKFGTARTRAMVLGILHRMRVAKRTTASSSATQIAKNITRKTTAAKKPAPNADPAMVAILTANDDKPNETSQPILVMRDGKLHASERLTDACCRFPLGDPAKPGFGFCAKETVPMQSYCEAHMRRVFETVKVKQPVPANDDKVLA